jgi:glycosyltransferase involved in cell wall biosynthesis
MAAALVRMHRDPTLRDRLREGARERVREFVLSRVAERYDAIYADVVARVRATS